MWVNNNTFHKWTIIEPGQLEKWTIKEDLLYIDSIYINYGAIRKFKGNFRIYRSTNYLNSTRPKVSNTKNPCNDCAIYLLNIQLGAKSRIETYRQQKFVMWH